MDREATQQTNGNGHGGREAARRATAEAVSAGESPGRGPAWVAGLGAMAGDTATAPVRLGARIGRALAGRIPPADLDERDPDYIRESLPRLWLLASLYYRGEVRGLGNIPEEGGVLLVGNHSGGNLT